MDPLPLSNRNVRAAIAWATVVFHLIACVGLLLVAQGTEANADELLRAHYVGQHPAIWIAVWIAWMFASTSLLAFCIVWSAAMRDSGASKLATRVACEIVAVGVVCDLLGETLQIVGAHFYEPDVPAIVAFAGRAYQFLSPAVANGLYCVGGTLLSVIAWRSGWLRGWAGGLGFAMWLVGFGLTLGGLLNHRELLAATGAGVMVLFVAFASIVAWRLGRPVQEDSMTSS